MFFNKINKILEGTFQSLKSNLKTKWLYDTSPEDTAAAEGAFLGAKTNPNN